MKTGGITAFDKRDFGLDLRFTHRTEQFFDAQSNVQLEVLDVFIDYTRSNGPKRDAFDWQVPKAQFRRSNLLRHSGRGRLSAIRCLTHCRGVGAGAMCSAARRAAGGTLSGAVLIAAARRPVTHAHASGGMSLPGVSSLRCTAFARDGACVP